MGEVEEESKRSRLRLRKKRKVHRILNASAKICFLVVNGQSFLVIDGSLLNLFWLEKKKKKNKNKKKQKQNKKGNNNIDHDHYGGNFDKSLHDDNGIIYSEGYDTDEDNEN